MLEKLWDKRVLLAIVLLELFIIVSFLFVDTNIDTDKYQQQIDLLNAKVDSLHQENQYLENGIETMYMEVEQYRDEADRLAAALDRIRKNKDEKINSVNNFNHSELQSFFTERYDSISNGN